MIRKKKNHPERRPHQAPHRAGSPPPQFNPGGMASSVGYVVVLVAGLRQPCRQKRGRDVAMRKNHGSWLPF